MSFWKGGRYLGTPFFDLLNFCRGRSLIVTQRQSTLFLDCRAGWGPTGATLAVKRGAPPIALDIHLEDGRVMDQAVDGSERHGLIAEPRRMPSSLIELVSHVTITDPHHFLFGQRLAVARGRSGRGPAYVVVELADGRKRSVRIAATDLVPPADTPSAPGPQLPRISVRTLIPLARHLNRILNLLIEEVIRDEPSSPSASSRCVSTANPAFATSPSRQDQPVCGVSSASVVGSVARDANPDRSDTGEAVATDAAYGHAGKGGGPC